MERLLVIKIIGAFLTVIACTFGGLLASQRYRQRVTDLRCCQTALGMLETEISYGATPLPAALLGISQRLGGSGQVALLLRRAGEMLSMGRGTTAAEAWAKAVDELDGSLIATDRDVLRNLGHRLGVSDRPDQLRNLRLITEQLHQQQEEAEGERLRYERMWQTLGFLTGLMIVLALL